MKTIQIQLTSSDARLIYLAAQQRQRAFANLKNQSVETKQLDFDLTVALHRMSIQLPPYQEIKNVG